MRTLIILLLLCPVFLIGQTAQPLQGDFQLVGEGTGSTTINDSTFRLTIEFNSDQYNSGYLPTQIQTGYRMLDSKGHAFRITGVNSSNFVEANIDVVRDTTTYTAPTGIVLIYKELFSGLIPSYAVNSIGISPIMEARIHRHNAFISQSSTTGSDVSFNSDRNILRLWEVGDNIGGSSLSDMFEYLYFTAPTISVNISPSTTVYEIGDQQQVIATATTANNGGATLTNGSLALSWSGGSENVSYGASLSAKDTIIFTPTQGGSINYERSSYSWQASQEWSGAGESGTANSNTQTVQGVYPVLYGVSSTDYSAIGNIYEASGFSKLVQTEGNKNVTFTGTGFLYFAVPSTWNDVNLSVIYDHNGFDVTASFTSYDITVSSSGLTNDWSGVSYKLYKLNNLTTASGFTYQFNR
jgi:hypothetical protein